jgi:hypothetical protein
LLSEIPSIQINTYLAEEPGISLNGTEKPVWVHDEINRRI